MSLLLTGSLVHAGSVQLPQTVQTKCYNTTGTEIPCTGMEQDGDIRAGVVWPVPRFMDNGDGTVMERLIGPVWTKDAGTSIVGSCARGIHSPV